MPQSLGTGQIQKIGRQLALRLSVATLADRLGSLCMDSNPVESTIRPWAVVRSNWLFDGYLRSGKRAAAIMTLIRSARMTGNDP